MGSETRANGFMIFDSNYWDDPGTTCGGAIGSGADAAPHDAWLQSNPINLTAFTGAVITFQQQYWHYQATTTLEVSVNNGAWTEVYSNPAFLSANAEWVTVNLSAIAGGQPNVRFRFRFNGFYYWWCIDDVTIYVPNTDDLLLNNARYTTSGNNAENLSLNLPYDQYPVPFITPFVFSGKANNIGSNSQTGVTLNVKVSNSSNTTLYNNSSAATSIAAGASPTLTLSTPYTPANTLGDYSIAYNLTFSGTDNHPENNRDTLDYSITQYSMSRDEGPVAESFVPASTYINSPMRIGNYFEAFANGQSLFSISAAIAEGTEIGSQLKGWVYNAGLDSVIAETEIYNVNLYDINQVGQERLIILDLTDPLPLLNDSIYLVMIGSLDGSSNLRVGRNGTSPNETSFVNYPNESAWYYVVRTPIVRMQVFANNARPGCTDASAMNFEPGALINDGSCRYPGCTIVGSSNYNPSSNFDDGSCILLGCTDPLANNYNPLATTDDGSCSYATVGCTNSQASNYNPNATEDDGSCLFPGCTDPAANNFDPQANANDGSCFYNVYGCTNSSAANFNPSATIDDGSCVFAGCTDQSASNYNSSATIDDGSCLYPGCTDPTAYNYNPTANLDNGLCFYAGCTNASADNYNPNASIDDGSCQIGGCTTPSASNYTPTATYDNGTCIIVGCADPTATNYNPATTENNPDLCIYGDILGCTDPVASNYDEFANVDDGSCVYFGCTNPEADNYNPFAIEDDGSCFIAGCTNPLAVNYNPEATQDNGSCQFLGCTNPEADNYNALATIEDGSCFFLGCTNENATNFDPNATVDDGSCFVLGCTNSGANNYNPEATLNDGSCTFSATQANFSLSTNEGCAPLNVTVTNLTPASPGCDCLGACVYTASNGQSITSCSEFVSFLFTQPGTYTIALQHNQFDGSTNYTSEEIVVWPAPIAPEIAYNNANLEMVCSNCGSNSVTWQTDGVYWEEQTSVLSILQNGVPNNGFYSASITDANGCFASSETQLVLQPFFTLEQNSAECSPANAVITDLTDPMNGLSCSVSVENGQATSVVPGSTFAYPIFNSGAFNVTMTCTLGAFSGIYSLPFTVSQFTIPVLEFNAQTGQVVCTNFDGNLTLTWAIDNTALPELNNQSSVSASLGTNFTATFSELECSASASIQVVSVNEHDVSTLYAFPNPTSGLLQLDIPEYGFMLDVYDVVGRKVESMFINHAGTNILDFNNLNNGTYYLRGIGQKTQYRTTFVIQH
jgi:hypothetical protein